MKNEVTQDEMVAMVQQFRKGKGKAGAMERESIQEL